MKTEQMCTTHECEICGEKLYEYTTLNRMGTFLVMMAVMFVTISAITLLENSSEKLCYERHYLSGRDTNLEVVRTVDIKCPQE